MKIGILETGGPPGGLAERFGDYPDMVRRLLGDGHAFTTYDVARDEPPAIPETQDAYVITVSPAGVYDGLPWILRLSEWLRARKSLEEGKGWSCVLIYVDAVTVKNTH